MKNRNKKDGPAARVAGPAPSYAATAGLRCYKFPTATVYAPGRLVAELRADLYDLRGPQADAYYTELSS